MKKFIFTNRKIAVGVITMTLLIAVGICISPAVVNASTKEATSYESIQIHDGDTLWSLAKEYNTSELSINDYVKEIKELNNLSSDYINDGNYLIIPVYN